ncbi:Uncharacterized protein TCM_031819 [Theobroma cacao]|uniref:Uncharacterized protein n=1 Tax=Theobroma cacao TaxID=3641 RepID=A0A061F8T4_THECC|nr:Uncharacterized protein TCM_031819 [Theobroma cacao]
MVDLLIHHNVGLNELMADKYWEDVLHDFLTGQKRFDSLSSDTTYTSNSNFMCVTNSDIAYIGAMYLHNIGQPRARNPHGRTHPNLEVFSRHLEKNYLKHTYNACGEPNEDLWW